MSSRFDPLDFAALVAAAGLATAAGLASAESHAELQHGYPLSAQGSGRSAAVERVDKRHVGAIERAGSDAASSGDPRA